ncbi:hypothetical protein HDF13_002844 [Edaphobacter lichenicola]|uniref:Uncharacterized protein n=1 Tax=Tunturiibacter gelidiferens TaxID=3069689 RepID=A0ACC5P1C2_9BACT|nr:hypothetical protein [Edaphobacter lichenicola]
MQTDSDHPVLPEQERSKIKFEFVTHFFDLKSALLFFHVHHAEHHVVTSKKPWSNTPIWPNPLQKAQQILKDPSRTTARKKSPSKLINRPKKT